MYVCLSFWVYARVSVAHTIETKSYNLQLEAVVSYLMWVMEIQLGASERAASAFNYDNSLAPI